jgi:hypothetical protein
MNVGVAITVECGMSGGAGSRLGSDPPSLAKRAMVGKSDCSLLTASGCGVKDALDAEDGRGIA